MRWNEEGVFLQTVNTLRNPPGDDEDGSNDDQWVRIRVYVGLNGVKWLDEERVLMSLTVRVVGEVLQLQLNVILLELKVETEMVQVNVVEHVEVDGGKLMGMNMKKLRLVQLLLVVMINLMALKRMMMMMMTVVVVVAVVMIDLDSLELDWDQLRVEIGLMKNHLNWSTVTMMVRVSLNPMMDLALKRAVNDYCHLDCRCLLMEWLEQ